MSRLHQRTEQLYRQEKVPRRRRGIPVLRFSACLLLGLASVAAHAQEKASEDSGPTTEQESNNTIAEVRVEGLRRVGRDAALAGVKSMVGTVYDPDLIAEDLRTLWKSGFFRDIRISRERVPQGWRLIFELVEKSSIREVRYAGNDEISEEDIKAVVDVKPFTILNVELIKRNAGKIKDLYVEKGYYLAEVTHRVEPVKGSEHEVDVVFDIIENAKVMVREISFVGNKHLSDAQLKGAMLNTKEGSELSWLNQSGTYKEEFFQSDVFRIQMLYYDNGYVTVRIGEPTATISPDRQYIYLSVPIEEGEQYTIGSINFSGEVELVDKSGKVLVNEEKLRDRLTIKSANTFNRSQLFADVQSLTDAYRDHGYAYANVTPNSKIDAENRRVDLDLSVERGDMVYIERIEVVGNTKTRDKVVRREMRINEGDHYSASLINRSRARIYQLGFFETVNVATTQGSRPDLMNINIEIKERSTGTFQIGAGFSSVDSFIATAQISQNNFLGNGQTLSISAQLSFGDFARQLATVNFFEPYFLDSRWSFGLSGFLTQRLFRDFQRNAKGFSPSFGYLLTPDIRLNFGYTIEQIKITTDVLGNGAALANLNRDGFSSSVNGSISYDTRDNRLFPSDGQYHSVNLEASEEFLGADPGLTFRRLQVTSRFYHPLPASLVLRLNATLGWVFGGGEQGVPISERFAPGGIFSVRGFEIRGLGPTVPALTTGDPGGATSVVTIGGNKQAIFNLEVEFPIVEAAGIKGVIFADAGNAFNDDENLFYINTPSERKPSAFLRRSGREIDPPWVSTILLDLAFGGSVPLGHCALSGVCPSPNVIQMIEGSYSSSPLVTRFRCDNV
ncbi:MAG: outer membrane protein assembly factor BamA [Myxococcota bacterium]